MNSENDNILELKGIKKYFPVDKGLFSKLTSKSKDENVKAVDGISLSLKKGDIFALVGESGCGKTTTARLIGGLDFETEGSLLWNNEIMPPAKRKNRNFRKRIQYIFQNPFVSLHPRMKVGKQLSHALVIQNDLSDPKRYEVNKKALYGEISLFVFIILAIINFLFGYTKFYKNINGQAPGFYIGGLCLIIGFVLFYYLNFKQHREYKDEAVLNILKEVGLNPPIDYYEKYPHELSGGERQRVAIARGIIVNPELIIADEPTSMLDVSIRASILDLLANLKSKFNLTILFITHDLAVARYFCNKIAVMYVGEIVEQGEINEIFNNPKHPYTYTLIKAIPIPDPNSKSDFKIPSGEVPDAINPPSGCRFHPRCEYVKDICKTEKPKLESYSDNQNVACHFYKDLLNENKLKL